MQISLACFLKINSLVKPVELIAIFSLKYSLCFYLFEETLASKHYKAHQVNNYVLWLRVIMGNWSFCFCYLCKQSGENVRIAYKKKCNLLRNQYLKGDDPSAVDKTRVAIRDLHTQIKVSIHSVEAVSKRIETLSLNFLNWYKRMSVSLTVTL